MYFVYVYDVTKKLFNNINEAKIVAKVLDISLDQVLFQDLNPSSKEQICIEETLNKFRIGYPLDYILQQVIFLGQRFFVDESVLIPRPETEFWAGNLINKIKSKKTDYQNLTLVDVGSGSGVIALALAKYFGHVVALDIDEKALKVFSTNLDNYNKTSILQKTKVSIIRSNLLENLPVNLVNGKWILVANLPYVPSEDQVSAAKNKIDFEPELAIFSGVDGLDLFRQLIIQLKTNFSHNLHNNLPDEMYFELDPRNILEAKDYVIELLPIYDWLVERDENDLERILILSKKTDSNME